MDQRSCNGLRTMICHWPMHLEAKVMLTHRNPSLTLLLLNWHLCMAFACVSIILWLSTCELAGPPLLCLFGHCGSLHITICRRGLLVSAVGCTNLYMKRMTGLLFLYAQYSDDPCLELLAVDTKNLCCLVPGTRRNKKLTIRGIWLLESNFRLCV